MFVNAFHRAKNIAALKPVTPKHTAETINTSNAIKPVPLTKENTCSLISLNNLCVLFLNA